MKNWWESKTLWFNVILSLIAIATLAADTFQEYEKILLFTSGVGNIILRIFFTQMGIRANVT